MDFEKKFEKVLKTLTNQFGNDLDIQGVLFLIGVQELGRGPIKFSKEAKIDVMHIAICTLLSPYGYYTYQGNDKEGWPQWKINKKLPPLELEQQLNLMKRAIVEYFNNKELVN